MHTNFSQVNVEKEISNDSSLLKVVQEVLQIRKDMPAINSGTLELIKKGELPSHILAYKRKLENEEVLVLINFSSTKQKYSLKENWKTIFNMQEEDYKLEGENLLLPYTGMILLHP